MAYRAAIPVLVTGIQRAAGVGARGWLDPGHKARDDWIWPIVSYSRQAVAKLV
jgi:hypothetical protein